MDGHRLIAFAIIFSALLGTWVFRYEPIYNTGLIHRNRITGATCDVTVECWFASSPREY